MSDDDFNARVMAEFRANHGRVGGPVEGVPLLLLHTTGARTGSEPINPMMYLRDGERYLVSPERDERFAEQARRYPGFAAYQAKTTRVIPSSPSGRRPKKRTRNDG